MTKVKDPNTDKRCHKIVAVDCDGTMAGVFDTIKTACDKYGLTAHLVRRSCKTGSLYRGIRWMYENEYHQAWLNGRTDRLRYDRPKWQKPMQRGDRAGHGPSDETLRTYVRTLIKIYGPNATLADIARRIGTDKVKDNVRDIIYDNIVNARPSG